MVYLPTFNHKNQLNVWPYMDPMGIDHEIVRLQATNLNKKASLRGRGGGKNAYKTIPSGKRSHSWLEYPRFQYRKYMFIQGPFSSQLCWFTGVYLKPPIIGFKMFPLKPNSQRRYAGYDNRVNIFPLPK